MLDESTPAAVQPLSTPTSSNKRVSLYVLHTVVVLYYAFCVVTAARWWKDEC